MRILLVEDDAALASAVCSYLAAKAFVVDVAPGLADARAALAAVQYAAVLLDLHLSDGDGLSLLPDVRALRERPIVIVLTARDQVTDRIRGLDAGADDYLIKPYDPARAAGAPARRRAAAQQPPVRPCCSSARSRSTWRATWCARTALPVTLTQKEWALLRVMATRPERIHTRENLADALYGFGDEADSNTLEVFISRLRRKLGRNHIQTLRGLGYRLSFSPEDEDE